MNSKKYVFLCTFLVLFTGNLNAILPDGLYDDIKMAEKQALDAQNQLEKHSKFMEEDSDFGPLEQEPRPIRVLLAILKNIVEDLEDLYLNRKTTTATAQEIDAVLKRIEPLLDITKNPLIITFFASKEGEVVRKKWEILETDIQKLHTMLKEGEIKDKEEARQAQELKQRQDQLRAQQEQKNLADQKKREELRQQVRPNAVSQQNIIIVVDSSEVASDHNTPMAQELGLALCQQAAPIVVSEHTIHTFMYMHKSNQAIDFANSPWANLREWLDNNWLLYEPSAKKTGDNIFLLVPKKFTTMQTQGLNIQSSKPVRWSEAIFKESISIYNNIEAQQIFYWFSADKNIVWNIYLTGHGELGEGRFFSKTPTLFTDNRFTQPFDLDKHNAEIAGLKLDEFRKLIRSLQTLSVNLFVYFTCFGGGYNLYLSYITPILAKGSILAGVQPQFTIVALSSTDAVTLSSISLRETCFSDKKSRENGKMDFLSFFDAVGRYALPPANYSEFELREILTPIIGIDDKFRDLLNMPQVKFARAESFVYLPMDPTKIMVITQAKARAASDENKPIEIPYKTVIPTFLGLAAAHIPTITINVDESKMPYIMSLLPGIGLNVIDKIEAKKVNAHNFFSHFNPTEFVARHFVFPKYYFIKELLLNKGGIKEEKNIFDEWPDKQADFVKLSNVLIGFISVKESDGSPARVGVVVIFSNQNGQVFMLRLPKKQHVLLKSEFEKNIQLQPLKKTVAVQNKSPEEISRQYVSLLRGNDVYTQKWWKVNELLPDEFATNKIFEPLYKLVEAKEQEAKNQASIAQKIEQLTPKTRSENIAQAIRAADVEVVRRLLQEPFDKNYQIIVQEDPKNYRTTIKETDPNLITYALDFLVKKAKDITAQGNATEQQKKELLDLLSIVQLLRDKNLNIPLQEKAKDYWSQMKTFSIQGPTAPILQGYMEELSK